MKNGVLRQLVLLAIGATLVGASVLSLPNQPGARALTGSDFNPGNIISDSVMFSGYSMGAPEIQAFLNARVPRCTLGDPGKPAGGWYAPHNVYLANNCLKDYRENIPSLGGDRFCAAVQGGDLSAAEIIARVGQACNVSPRALIVLLEKEQSLISDSWPNQRQYASATGFNCPDTAPCSVASAGFFKQLYSGARQLQVYGNAPFTWYPVGQVSQIRFHPNADCGSSAVRIENRATAALYYYTPYQPNAAALNNLKGVGDACSAYGNRNFWRIYSEWFGSPQEVAGSKDFITAVYADVLGRSPEPEGLNYWISRMASGMPRTDMANAFNSSTEYFTIKINEAYQKALKRSPEQGGFSFWMNQLRWGALSPEDLYARFLYSDEMYNVQGGGTNQGYVTALYRELLGREPEPEGLQYWTSRLDSGMPRYMISNGIWYSPERYNVRVVEAYQKFLGRDATPGEQEYWSNIARRFGPTAMRSSIIGTNEYWERANARY